MKREVALTAIVSMLLMFTIVPSFASSSNSFSGQNAPDFHLADLSNTQHSLSDYQRSIVVLDFFSVECSDCQVSAKNVLVPLYNNVYNNSSSGDVKVQFLSIETTGASADTINSTYVNSTGITWPILTGGDNLKNSYSSNGIPTVYVIDPAGKIVLSMAHPLDIETLKAVIDNLLEVNAHATPTPTNPSTIPTATPSTSPTPTPTPPETILNANTSDTSKAIQSSDTAAASPLAPSKSVASASITSDTQEKGPSAGLENCSLLLTQQASISTTSQKCLLYSTSLLTPIVPSTVLTQAAAMSAEASALSQNAIPTITLPAETNSTASLPLQSVYEFSLLGLGAPTLLIGVLYLLLRRV